MSRVTLDDVARVAGVSRATASRALTGEGSVSSAARDKVREAAKKLNFSPHQAARALASSHTQTIALVIPEPSSFILGDPFLSFVITGISETLHTTRYQVILVIVRSDDLPTKVSRVLRSDRVDGAIVVSQHRTDHMAQIITGTDVPVVYVGRPLHGISQLYVDMDNRVAGQLATRYLITTGARRIACIAGPSDMAPVLDRTAGWRLALGEAGIVPGPLTHGAFTMTGGMESMRAILSRENTIDAVFVQSDLMAVGALHTLQGEGIVVPDQVKVVSVDNTEIGRTTSPPLSTVTNPADELAMRASRMLLRILDGSVSQADVTPEIIKPELVVRESA